MARGVFTTNQGSEVVIFLEKYRVETDQGFLPFEDFVIEEGYYVGENSYTINY